MDNLYIKIWQILKINKVIFSQAIAEDLTQECICCLLENLHKSENEQNKLIVSCARHFIYEYNKCVKLVDVEQLDMSDQLYIVENQNPPAITKIRGAKIRGEVIKPQELTISQLVDSKGDYKMTEISKLIGITNISLHRAIAIDRIGIKSFMLLKKIPYFNRKMVASNINKLLFHYKINKKHLPTNNNSLSNYYYGINNGFSYTQAHKIAIWLKNNYNIKGVLDDIY